MARIPTGPTGASELVGSTPMAELTGLLGEEDAASGVKLFGKPEAFNPSGSVKDGSACR